MVTMNDAQTLLEKIQSLSNDQIAQVEDFVDSLWEQSATGKIPKKEFIDFPVDLGPWPEGISLRREDIYGDDER